MIEGPPRAALFRLRDPVPVLDKRRMTDLLPVALLSLVFMFGTVALALVTYGLTRLAASHLIDEKTEGLGGSITFRIASLHALVISLVFAQETQSFRDVQAGLVREATVVTDIFYDLDRYGTPEAGEHRGRVAAYARAVVEEDWPRLQADGVLAERTYALWEETYEFVLDLVPANGRQEALRDHMLTGIHQIADLRQARVNMADIAIPLLFWIAAVGGLIFVCVPYFIFPPTPLNLVLIAMFASYTGLIIGTIYGFSNPFSPPAALSPEPFVKLVAGEMGAWPN